MISVIIITKNAASKIEECLRSVRWADEILVLDGGSTDQTVKIARKHGARVARQTGKNYSDWRNQGAKLARGDWLFYVDYDERVPEELRGEILKVVVMGPAAGSSQPTSSVRVLSDLAGARRDSLRPRHPSTLIAHAVPRRNFVFGKELKHGGWYPDYVLRLIKKSQLIKWQGELHEQPKIKGEISYLKNALIHHKEDSLSDMVAKTNIWSEVEAKLLYKAGHPQMTWWRFWKIMATEILDRLIIKGGILDGGEGIIYGIYQGWSKFLTYAKLWEMQIVAKNEKRKTDNI